MLFVDRKDSDKDVEKVINFYKRLGFSKIFITENPTNKKLTEIYETKIKPILKEADKLAKDLEKEMKKPEAERNKDLAPIKKPILSVYFNGHGVFETETKIILNENKEKEMFFEIESKLSVLSK